MTVQELIDFLSSIEDKSLPVYVRGPQEEAGVAILGREYPVQAGNQITDNNGAFIGLS